MQPHLPWIVFRSGLPQPAYTSHGEPYGLWTWEVLFHSLQQFVDCILLLSSLLVVVKAHYRQIMSDPPHSWTSDAAGPVCIFTAPSRKKNSLKQPRVAHRRSPLARRFTCLIEWTSRQKYTSVPVTGDLPSKEWYWYHLGALVILAKELSQEKSQHNR